MTINIEVHDQIVGGGGGGVQGGRGGRLVSDGIVRVFSISELELFFCFLAELVFF